VLLFTLICITEGPLGTYKLFASVYGGKSDEDININVHNEHTLIELKMVSLYNSMLELFKDNGHCDVMYSAYMGDAMCQIGCEEWLINMVGTVLENIMFWCQLFGQGSYQRKGD
jgi:hypothetical protein